MFNLTVDEAHTFYVGNNGWLVHNQNTRATSGNFFSGYNSLPKPNATTNQRLNNIIRDMYKPGVWGDGSTATAVKIENSVGTVLPGRTTTHATKADDLIRGLDNLLTDAGRNRPGYQPLTADERRLAQQLRDSLANAKDTPAFFKGKVKLPCE